MTQMPPPAKITLGASAGWPTTMRALVAQRRTLLLQGPIGWFFRDLSEVLTRHGQTVTKVHFNGGDELYWRGPGAVRYAGELADLSQWLRQRLLADRIDAIVLFGQMRPIHVIARQVARDLGVQIFVLEEGYIRPNYVTLERRGVNALSRLPRTGDYYERRVADRPTAAPQPTHQKLSRTALMAMAYYVAATVLKPLYPHAVHHRSLNGVTEGLRWVRAGVRRVRYGVTERRAQPRLCSPAQSGRWFLVPLQVHDDSQIRHHSRFKCIEDFITEVMTSFAAHAPADTGLVIKHHPMDRAYTDYRQLIARLSAQLGLGLGQRVHYIHDQHLPTLLNHTRGVVTINSTVGLQALLHDRPVITLGESVYGVSGLVYGQPLAQFWGNPGQVNRVLYERFRQHLVAHTQLNASFYAQSPALAQAPRPAQADAAHDLPASAMWVADT